MTAFRIGRGLPPAIGRALHRIERRLVQRGGIPGAERVVVVAGVNEPGIVAGLSDGPRVVVPGAADGAPAPWAAGVVASASALVLLDPTEAAWLPEGTRCPVVVAGLPRPEQAAPGHGLDPGGHDGLARLWEAEVGPAPDSGPGVAWIGGRGAAPLAAALEAWAQLRAVVALPRTPRHEMLIRGETLFAASSLEAIEATRLLLASRPLIAELAHRGRRSMDTLDPVDDVADRFAEALLLAAEARA